MEEKIILKELNKNSVWEILKLDVHDYQKKFVAPNSISIAQAYFEDTAWFRGIYLGDTAVGFVMLEIDKEKQEYYLWRFMIDKNYQGKGYGKKALELTIDYVKTLPGYKELKSSYVPGEGNAGPFYRNLGFIETGEIDEGEKVIVLNK